MAREVDPNAQQGRLIIKDFPGFRPNWDPHDLPPGIAMHQTNAMSLRPGELRVRPGFRVVFFAEN